MSPSPQWSPSPLVLLHGFTGTPAAFDPVLQHLDRPGHTPALLGHGAPFDAEDWAGEIRRLADIHRTYAPIHLVGYSLGARVALGWAATFPDQIARLTLIGVHPGLDPDQRPARQAWEDSLVKALQTQGLPAFIDSWERLPLWETQRDLPEAVRQRQRQARLSHDPAGLAHSLQRCGLSRMPDLRPALASLLFPVELVVGALDTRFIALARQMIPALPEGRLHLVPQVGHNVVLEAPQALAALLQRAPQP